MQFWDWGIPTARSVREVASLKSDTLKFTLIASGGISSGLDVAKCIALGADMTASARPVLLEFHRRGRKGVVELIRRWGETLRGAMFLSGARDLRALQTAPLVGSSPA
jgi:isopentenyl-diphosphate delta-isomerase